MTKIYEKAPAKINLLLDVLRKRDDGYHEVEMIMTMVDLADRLEMEELPGDQHCVVQPSGLHSAGREKSCLSGGQAHQGALSALKRGVYIHLDKQIPVAAGLPGGSSDAAATLRGLNRLWNLELPVGELEALGAELGSDVPFCVRGGTALPRRTGRSWRASRRRRNAGSSGEAADQRIHSGCLRQASCERSEGALRPFRTCWSAISAVVSRVCAHALGNVLESVTLAEYPEVRK